MDTMLVECSMSAQYPAAGYLCLKYEENFVTMECQPYRKRKGEFHTARSFQSKLEVFLDIRSIFAKGVIKPFNQI